MDTTNCRALLENGLQALDIALTDDQCQKLLKYLSLLERWNKVYNLTAVRDPVEMVGRHLLDSLSILKFLPPGQNRLLDIGSGAGLPGIPIAVSRVDIDCLMIDSNAKKTRFIQQACAELGLANARPMQNRIESFEDQLFDIIVSRAFSEPQRVLELAEHRCEPDASVVLMLGHVEGKLDQIPDSFELECVESVRIPGVEATRHIAVCRPARNHNV